MVSTTRQLVGTFEEMEFGSIFGKEEKPPRFNSVCLRCEKSFRPLSRFHRVCTECKSRPSYRGAAWLSHFFG